MEAEACVDNADLGAVATKTPTLWRDLGVMGQLPLTGRPVYDMLKDPVNRINTCLYPNPPGMVTDSNFEGTRARIGRGTGTTTTFHEYFHAWQDLREGDDDMFALAVPDALATNLLKEASAVAYEMAAAREARNLHLPFAPPSQLVRQSFAGTVTTTTRSSSDDPDNLRTFNAAYDQSWKQGAALAAPDREAAALAAGGQAVVRRLLSGDDKHWKESYSAIALGNIRNNPDAFRADPASPGYDAKRRRTFAAEGGLSEKITFLPPEFTGPGATAAVNDALKRLGIDAATARQAKTAAAPGTKPGS